MTEVSNPSPVSGSPSTPVVGASDSPKGSPASIDTNAKFGSFNELPPEVKDMMLKGIAQNICIAIKRQADDLKKAMREGRNQG
jgi:hypothetical protein